MTAPATAPKLAPWAREMGDLFRSGSCAQFILHGNIFDAVPHAGRMLSVKDYLKEVMFGSYDLVLYYDRSRGLQAVKGNEDWAKWLDDAIGSTPQRMSILREPGSALELIDRYILRTTNLMSIAESKPSTRRIAVLIDFAEFVVPRGEAVSLGGAFSANVVKVLNWANDPTVLHANIVTVLVTEEAGELNPLVVENPHAVTLRVPLPNESEMQEYLTALIASDMKELPSKSDVPIETLAKRLTGLSRVGARRVISLAIRGGERITNAWLTRMKKEAIERECQGLLEFIESSLTLDHVAGLDAVRTWLREDTELLRRGALHALPMGYLIAGRIGTGKTFIVTCWAGELGIPCVVFKNFRDRWVGATESNLEKIFAVLRALGQVVVFVDEADQAAGKREGGDGDSGLSGRVYSMLAKEMSDTRNRGRIIWVFATSRPDLLEVDLKRQGRLDVHIPLFPPQTKEERHALLKSVAKKIKVPLEDSDLPEMPEDIALGGNEIEGVFVRGLRIYELSPEPRPPLKEILQNVFKEVRPSAHTRKLEFMDLVAVKECTDSRFLPEQYREMKPEEIERKIDELRRYM